MKYNAFLSYSHSQDTELSASIEKALEAFAKPTFKRRALEVFRDSNDLSLSPDLGDKLQDSLDNSEYFVCMANPLYAQSIWCKREVQYWLDHKSLEQFIIVLTDGGIEYDEDANDFNWELTDALPDNLSKVFKGTPFYLDFRGIPKDELTLDHAEFRRRLVLLAATIHGKSVGDMEGEAALQYKRTLRIRNFAIGILSTLLMIAIAASVIAVNKKNEALFSTYLANSQGQFNEDPTKSLRLAETAYLFGKDHGFSTQDVEDQLIRVFYSGYGFYQDPSLEFPAFSEKEIDRYQGVSTPFYQDVMKITDSIAIAIPKDFYLRNNFDLYIDEEVQSATYVVASIALGYTRIYYISKELDRYVIEEENFFLSDFLGYTGYIEDVDISDDGKFTILGSANSKTAYIDNDGYRKMPNRNIFKDRAILNSDNDLNISHVAFVNGGEYIGTACYESETINEKRVDGAKVIYYYKVSSFPYIEMISSDDKLGITSLDGNYHVELFNEDEMINNTYFFEQVIKDSEGEMVVEFPKSTVITYDAFLESPDGNFRANYQGLYNSHQDLLIKLDLDFIDNSGVAICFSKDSKYFKVSYLDSLQRVFPLDPKLIIDRMNNLKSMGKIAPLNSVDKERFMVSD